MMLDQKTPAAPCPPKVRRQKVRTDWRAGLNFALLFTNVYAWYDNVEPWILIGSVACIVAFALALEAQRSSVFRSTLIALLAIGFIL